MKGDQDLSRWLVQEVQLLLEESHVGLYELVWLLRSEGSEMAEADMHRIARSALDELLSNGHLLAWFRWPDGEPVRDEQRPVAELTEIWKEPTSDDDYLALRD